MQLNITAVAADIVGVTDHTNTDASLMAAASDAERWSANLNVLLIDDDPDDRLLLRDLIERGDRSISCSVASDFEAGRVAILDGGYDAFLVDYRLGSRSGVELIAETAARASGPMILLTGVGNPEVDDASLAAGAADYLTKRDLSAETARRSIRYAVEMWRARRQAEVERARYQSLFDGVPVGLFRTTREGMLLEINEAAVEMLAHGGRDELIGRRLHDVWPQREGFDRLFDALCHQRETAGADVELCRPDGSSTWVTLGARPVSSRSGVAWIEWAMTDITPRKLAEQRARLGAALLDEVRSAVIVTDPEGVCTFWNRHAERMYGWTAAEAVGRHITQLTVPDDGLEEAAEAMAGIAATGQWEGEFRVRRKDRSTFVAQIHNAILQDERGTPSGIVGVSMDLTATKEREAAIHRYQEMIAAAFDASPIAKAIVSPGGEILSCNRALAVFLGTPADDLVGAHFRDFSHPDDIGADSEQFVALMRGEIDSYTMDKRFVRSDGGVAWGRLQGSLVRDEQGGIRYGLGQVIDITDRKAAADRIRFQASLLDQVHHAVMATDLEGTLTYWNRQAEELYGWRAEEVIGRNVFDVTSPGAPPEEVAIVTALLTEHGVWEGEVQLSKRDGSTLPAWASDTVLFDERGAPVGVVGIKVDLTDLRDAERRAERERALTTTLLSAVDVPIAILDHAGFVAAANPAWRELVPNQATGSYVPQCLNEQESQGSIQALHAGVVSVLDGTRNRYQFEYECHLDSRQHWVRTTVLGMSDGGAVIAHWDITDERIARATLEETIRAKDQFIASISHELRTPLTAVVGMAEVLRDGDYPPEDRGEYEAILADQASEVSLIVEDLLVAGRLESKTLTVRPSLISLADDARAVLRPLERSHRIEIQLDIDRDAETAFADPLRFRQILRNLVSNAIRYGRSPITVRAERLDQRLLVSVVDHGDGIPSDAVQHMFTPYSRFGGAEGQPLSVGLGLHVARRLAQLMGGDLGYRRDDGTTVFRLTLPASDR